MRQPAGEQQARRLIGFVMLGLVLLAGAAGLLYHVHQSAVSETSLAPVAYEYTVDQSVQTGVNYFQSSFYGNTPGATNTAYVADLTDTIDASLTYTFHASRPIELTTMYSAVATVREKYVLGTDGKDISNVWSKEYPLIKPVTSTAITSDIAINPSTVLPFAEYRKLADQLKTSLALPASSEVTLTFMVHVSGKVEGTPFDDIRVSTVGMPLDQPIFKIENKFEKQEKKQVVTQAAKSNQSTLRMYEQIAAGLLAIFGVAAIGYGMRKQIFKSPYQRELDKIYRYHDGLIIKASARTDLAHKTMVPVQSFDDILNLEEELKSPIVASSAGPSATRFMIIHGDIVYVYTLGKVEKDDLRSGRSIKEIEAFIEGHRSATVDQSPAPKTAAAGSHSRTHPKGRV